MLRLLLDAVKTEQEVTSSQVDVVVTIAGRNAGDQLVEGVAARGDGFIGHRIELASPCVALDRGVESLRVKRLEPGANRASS